MPKDQALPSTVDERFAKIRKASLAMQKKSRDSFSSLSFSYWIFIASMTDRPFSITVQQTGDCRALPNAPPAPCPSRVYTASSGTNRNFIDVNFLATPPP